MNMPGRTAEERAVMLMDRVRKLYCNLKIDVSEDIMRTLHDDTVSAFRVAYFDGEKRGQLKGRALAKLTTEERAALGLDV